MGLALSCGAACGHGSSSGGTAAGGSAAVASGGGGLPVATGGNAESSGGYFAGEGGIAVGGQSGGTPTVAGGQGGGGGSLPNSGGSAGVAPQCLDLFGRPMFYATAQGGVEWDSHYWSEFAHEVEFATPDPADPVMLANRRGTGEVTVGGDGTLRMTGSQPRLYLGTSDAHPWKNVEVTVTYQRLEDDETPYAGLVVGARSGPNGHGEDNCTATTYYARMRHDGNVDVAKELEHPNAEARATLNIWNGHPLARGVWFTMKYIVTNTAQGSVRLRVFRDRSSDGVGWEQLVDVLDEGGWAPPSACSYPADYVISDGGGVVFLRNTGLIGQGALYKDLTVREVDPQLPCE